MAQIPRTRDILDFQPLAPPNVPLELGRSGFGQALSNVSQIGFKYGLEARNAEDEIALEHLQENLLADELEIAQDLDAGAGGIPYGEFRAYADGKHQEAVAGFLSGDPAIQNLLPANQVRADKMLIRFRGKISRDAAKRSRELMNAELVSRELVRENEVLDQVAIIPNSLDALNNVKNYYSDLAERSKTNPAFNPATVENKRQAGMALAKASVFDRLTAELSNSISGLGTGTSHPEVNNILELNKLIDAGEFDELVSVREGGRAGLKRKAWLQASSATVAADAAVLKKNRRNAFKSFREAFDDSINPDRKHLVTPERIAKLTKQIFNSDMTAAGATALVQFGKKLITNPTKPSEAQDKIFNTVKNAIRKTIMEAKLRRVPVDMDDVLATVDGIKFTEMHYTQQSDLMEYIGKAVDPEFASVEAAIGRVTSRIEKSLGQKSIKSTTLEATILAKISGTGSPHFPELQGDLSGRIATAVDEFSREWIEQNPGQRLDESHIFEIAMKNIAKGKHGDPTTISIDPKALEEAVFKNKLGILELDPEQQFILDLHAVKQERLRIALETEKELAAKINSGKKLSTDEKNFRDQFGKLIQPDFTDGLKAENRGIARAVSIREQVEREKAKLDARSSGSKQRQEARRKQIEDGIESGDITQSKLDPTVIEEGQSAAPAPAPPQEAEDGKNSDLGAIRMPIVDADDARKVFNASTLQEMSGALSQIIQKNIRPQEIVSAADPMKNVGQIGFKPAVSVEPRKPSAAPVPKVQQRAAIKSAEQEQVESARKVFPRVVPNAESISRDELERRRKSFNKNKTLFALLDNRIESPQMAVVAELLFLAESRKGQASFDEEMAALPKKSDGWILSGDESRKARLKAGNLSEKEFMSVLSAELSERDFWPDAKISKMIAAIGEAVNSIGRDERLLAILDVLTAEAVRREEDKK